MTASAQESIAFSGIVLAGGRSRRMGTDKAALMLDGRTFLETQINKLLRLRTDDIIISGKPSSGLRAGSDLHGGPFFHAGPGLPVREVPDVMPGLGPLGGLYSCFPACRHDIALVLSVDVPLIRTSTLEGLLNAHIKNGGQATVLSHKGKNEPLLAVYRTDTAALLRELISAGELAVRAFLDRIDCRFYEFDGDPAELLNCNFPEDLDRMKDLEKDL